MDILFLIVDALNLIRRVYAAHPGEDGPERTTGALAATVQSLRRALRESRPTHAVCVFEGEGQSWRNRACPEYKAGRAPMPAALHERLPAFRQAFLEEGVSSISRPGLEADDVIATLACKAASRPGRVVILSTDKAFLQLLCERVSVRDHFGQRELDPGYVRQRFGVSPERLTDLLALCGDVTNHIRGVTGVGPKTAARLLADFGDLESILCRAGEMRGRVGAAIAAGREQVRLASSLARLQTGLDLGLNLSDFRVRGPRS